MDARLVDEFVLALPRLLRERPEIAGQIEAHLRAAFAGKDDIRAILETMDRRQAEWNERFDRVQAEWNERFDRVQAEWNERFDGQQAEWKAQQAEWNQRHDAAERRVEDRIDAAERSLRMMLGGIGARWGIQAEDGFREGLEALLREALRGYRVERWCGEDPAGEVYGRPSSVEIDIALVDGRCTLVELKSSLVASDVREFDRVAGFYERTQRDGKRSRRLIVTAWADDRAMEEADRLGIEVYSGR